MLNHVATKSSIAAKREVSEELGLDLDIENSRPVITVNFDAGFDDIYVVTKDVELSELTLQYEKVKDVKWASKEMIFSMIDEEIFIPWKKELVGLLFTMKD